MATPTSVMNKPLHLGLFAATCVSTFFIGTSLSEAMTVGTREDHFIEGGLYALVVMLILLSHELGHYVMARVHGVDATWPYFIPMPLGFGTMGAVIRLKDRIPSRNALVDIGAAGPLAGLLVAIPALFVGVSLSHVGPLPDDVTSGVPPGLSLLNLASFAGQFLRHLWFDGVEPVFPKYEVFGDNLLTWFAVRVIHGELKPGTDLFVHPVFLAAWFGLVMTMLNLLPVGQLDGGHLTAAWYGKDAEAIGERIAGGALIMALFFSVSWLMWFFLVTRLVGVEHPPVARPEEPLSRGRKVVVVITWVMTGLTFMPMPMSMV